MKRITALEKARQIAKYAAEKKGENIILMDMRNASMMCDWFVLVSAGSSRRLNAISSTIQDEMSKMRVFPAHVEGKNNPYWVLLDFQDVVVHLFHESIRDFYGLQRLWSDVPVEKVNSKCLAKTSPNG